MYNYHEGKGEKGRKRKRREKAVPTCCCYLELGEGESAASANLAVVLDGGATDSGAEKVQRTRSQLLGLRDACLTTNLLLGGLVEPRLHKALPILVEMAVGNDVVVLDHFPCQKNR